MLNLKKRKMKILKVCLLLSLTVMFFACNNNAWEYRYVSVKYQPQEKNSGSDTILDYLESNGWKFVQCFSDVKSNTKTSIINFVYKRKK